MSSSLCADPAESDPEVMRKVVLVWMVLVLAGCGRGYSEGDRTGKLIKLSHKGLAWKSWEGELLLGGLKSTDQGVAANTWDFTILDGAVAEQAQKCEGKQVQVHYVQWLAAGPSMDTDYEATRIAVEQ